MPRLFVDNLTVIDCSILDPDRGLIGASWAVDVELSGELDHQSMVFDFSRVKRTIKRVIDEEVDHKLLLPTAYSGTAITWEDNMQIEFIGKDSSVVKHASPAGAVCQIEVERINRNAVVEHLTGLILKALPSNVDQLKIELREEQAKGHYYRYSHGLKKHDGNCQRIAHGHRSQVQIWKDGKRSAILEKRIAKQWHDIYLATNEDFLSEKNGQLRFAYTTDQGQFSIELPSDRVHLMDCDSTVECIAEHLLSMISKDSAKIKVKAFEGIGKGAIASNH
jgi:6-pyruvoyl-tetrahydropterin synthase